MLKNTLIIINLSLVAALIAASFFDDKTASNAIEAVFFMMMIFYVIRGLYFSVISDDLNHYDRWMIADKYYKFSSTKTRLFNVTVDLIVPVGGSVGLLMSESPGLTPFFIGAFIVDKVGCSRLLDAYRFHVRG